MKTVYKHVKMMLFKEGAWAVVNKRKQNVIGTITNYKPWKTWVLEPNYGTIWSADCLADVQNFMGQLPPLGRAKFDVAKAATSEAALDTEKGGG